MAALTIRLRLIMIALIIVALFYLTVVVVKDIETQFLQPVDPASKGMLVSLALVFTVNLLVAIGLWV